MMSFQSGIQFLLPGVKLSFLDPSVSYSDDTLLNRHTAAVSLDPANKQRDDDCQGVSQCSYNVIPVPRLLGSRKLSCK
ncbi:hypothetical protein [Wolbachia endosymbiont of Dactylopius coccus]